MGKIKIIHIVDSLSIGGLEKVVIDICNNLDNNKFEIYLINLFDNKKELAIQLNSNIKYIELPYNSDSLTGLRSILYALSVVISLRRVVKKIKPDIVHTHPILHHLLVIVLAIKSLKKINYFHTIHTSVLHKNSLDRLKLLIDRIILRAYNPTLIAISDVIQKDNLKFHSTCSSICINNGVDLDKFSRRKYNMLKSYWGICDDQKVLTYVARLGPGKNHITLLKAFCRVAKTNQNITLVLAGDGPFRNLLEKFVSENNLKHKVVFLGSISNVPELLSISDAGVFPSEFEGFGLSLIEMMAMQLPVIASDNAVFKSLIKANVNGILFPVHDDESLAANIVALLGDQSKMARIGENAFSYSKEFSLQKMVLKHEECYKIVMR